MPASVGPPAVAAANVITIPFFARILLFRVFVVIGLKVLAIIIIVIVVIVLVMMDAAHHVTDTFLESRPVMELLYAIPLHRIIHAHHLNTNTATETTIISVSPQLFTISSI
ncbi:hypothetical protein RB195_014350 [Necator americanus]|uniref:7TM GPCR serpentine receptor class x (Srx) domain-containing protein n=1 Tax=Necator americanus TaxID=51031 RepID=A0ABR1DZS9_NECAM